MSAGHDETARWMTAAVELARRGLGKTAPNPAVGCVIVKNGRVVGRGFHQRAGGPHAEIVALREAGARARGATVYVTLEPCCHHGRTPPCTDALIEAGVARVVAGVQDPNPAVAGNGIRVLRRAGVECAIAPGGSECDDVVRSFRHWIETGRPWVQLKLAASLDGRIAAKGGDSKWISSAISRREVQRMRARADAVLVGAGTVLHDDPRLTCRTRGGSNPLRIVLDRHLATPPDARVLRGRGRCLIVTSSAASATRRRRLERAGAEVCAVPLRGRAGWERLLDLLGARGLHELLVEGGSKVATSLLRAGLVNTLTIFYNPRLIGADGIPLVGNLGVRSPKQALRLRTQATWRSGDDLVWRGTLT
jgi:diaminohydroxyphosphoribosylaminopyrimidine deaminase/5-amino-6-(5-phosphoribosylamino)uracil reductase